MRAVSGFRRVLREYRSFVLVVFGTGASILVRRIRCNPANIVFEGERGTSFPVLARASARAGGAHRPPYGRRDGAAHATVRSQPKLVGGFGGAVAGTIFLPSRGDPPLAALECRACQDASIRGRLRKTLIAAFALRGGRVRGASALPKLARAHWSQQCALARGSVAGSPAARRLSQC